MREWAVRFFWQRFHSCFKVLPDKKYPVDLLSCKMNGNGALKDTNEPFLVTIKTTTRVTGVEAFSFHSNAIQTILGLRLNLNTIKVHFNP